MARYAIPSERAIGKRNGTLRTAAIATATTLSTSHDKTAQWVGKHALREVLHL
jgi:3-methyladenine DNA glycosylase AlkD